MYVVSQLGKYNLNLNTIPETIQQKIVSKYIKLNSFFLLPYLSSQIEIANFARNTDL